MIQDTSSNNTSVTVRELYTLIDSKIGLVNSSIERLEAKFDNLESGRLNSLERDVSSMQGKLMVVPMLISAAMGTAGFIIQLVLRH